MADFRQLSIVVPVGPDDSAWRHLLPEFECFGLEPEILLSACQNPPPDLQLPGNVRWLKGAQGRACQLNAGAQQTRGEVIWFVHADSRFGTSKIAKTVGDFIEQGGESLGFFRLRFAGDGPWLTRVNGWAANLRSRWFGLPFGDQGFIIRKHLFRGLNGFDENIVLGEDLDFVVRTKDAGLALQELPATLITSARRYHQFGWLTTTMRHLRLTWKLTRQARRHLRTV